MILIDIKAFLSDPKFIIGLSVAIIFGILGIVYSVRTKFSNLSFLPDQFIFLIDNLLSEYDDIKIVHNRKSIDKNISLVKGIFMNTGKDDIDFKDSEENLKILLPENVKVVKAKIVDKSEHFLVDIVESSNNIIEIKAGLLKRKEFFKIEAIISFPDDADVNKVDSKNIYSVLDFFHRVKNLKIIKEQNYRDEKLQNTNKGFSKYIPIIIISLFLISDVFLNPRGLAPFTIADNELTYELLNGNDTVLVRVETYGADSLKVSGIKTDYKEVMTLDKFFNHTSWKPQIISITEDSSVKSMLIFKLTFLLAILISMIIWTTIESVQKRRVKKIKKIIRKNRC